MRRNLEQALGHLRGVTIYPEDIPESDTIPRAEDYHGAAWSIPYAKKSQGAAAMKRLCAYILKRCGFAPPTKKGA